MPFWCTYYFYQEDFISIGDMCNIFQARNRELFRRVFPELGHFDEHSTTARERKVPHRKNIRFAGKHLKIAF